MADKKDSTPPPLLLMPTSSGLTLSTASGSSLLMPVPQTEASLLAPEEEGEVDSFVGQTPPDTGSLGVSASDTFTYFKSPAAENGSDPFAQVGQMGGERPADPMFLPASSSPMMPPVNPGGPGYMATPPPPTAPGGQNMYRMAGPKRRVHAPMANSPMSGPGPMPGPGPLGGPMGGPGPLPPTSHMSPMMPPGGAPPMIRPTDQLPPGVQPTNHSSFMEIPPEGGNPYSFSGPQGAPPPLYNPNLSAYVPVQHHWFYSHSFEIRTVWKPFSLADSIQLEEAYKSGNQNVVVPVEGGRYDVNITERTRTAIYWEEVVTHVRRSSWFYKPEGDTRFMPYDEEFAIKLEEEYRTAITTNTWHKPLEFPGGETIVMHSPHVQVHFRPQAKPDEWGTTQDDSARPRVVKRGIDDFDQIQEGEPQQVDHVVFIVHGIGSTCDLRFRNIVECVDDFRVISHQILSSHFGQYQEEGRVGRVEFLPVRWHAALHGDATGIDRKLKAITLNSIGKLRHFTNDTLLDILFYASPKYCQKIADTVGSEINRLYSLFSNRNPGYQGGASVAGHSLGSLILFDLLSHQREPGMAEPDVAATPSDTSLQSTPSRESTPVAQDSSTDLSQQDSSSEFENIQSLEQLLEKLGLNDYVDTFKKEQIDLETLNLCSESDIKEMGLPMGPRKKIQGYIKEKKTKTLSRKEELLKKAQAEAEKRAQEQALQRQLEQQQQEAAAAEQAQENGSDPLMRQGSSTSVDYMVGGSGTGLPLVNHPQLRFMPTNFFALGSPIAMFLTVRGVENLGEEFRFPTCPGFFNIFHPFDPVAYRVEPLMLQHYPPKPVLMPHHKGRKRMHLELKESLAKMGSDIKQRIIDSVKTTWKYVNDFAAAHKAQPDVVEQEVNSVLAEMTQQQEQDNMEVESILSSQQEDEVMVGQVNQGRRVDYVLQEKPIESFNDYLFALGSHACYWESEDTVLMILKEIYGLMGIAPRRPGTQPLDYRMGAPPMASPTGILPPPTPPGVSPQKHRDMPPAGQYGGVGGVMPPPPTSTVGMPPHMYGSPQMNSPAQTQYPPTTNMGPPPMQGFVKTPLKNHPH